MEEVKQIVDNIRKGNIAAVYFLMGDEAYFIDRISDFIAEHVLTEEEKGFNQLILYGRETSIEDIIGNAKRFPMMAERQVVIVREAQHLSRQIEKLCHYVENPQTTTVLVFCYKFNKIDKRKKLYKTLLKGNAVLFESKKLYENQVAEWIRKMLKGKGYSISHKSAALLVEFLGTDLSRINNELEKLRIVLSKGSEITPETIEKHIGISKDYNNFELRRALGERDFVKATKIMKYFARNPKENPFVVTVTLLHSFFAQLLQYHGLRDHSPKHVASSLRINPYFVSEIQTAAKNYPMKKASHIVSYLREMDMKGKGVGAQNLSQEDLLKELLVKIA